MVLALSLFHPSIPQGQYATTCYLGYPWACCVKGFTPLCLTWAVMIDSDRLVLWLPGFHQGCEREQDGTGGSD